MFPLRTVLAGQDAQPIMTVLRLRVGRVAVHGITVGTQEVVRGEAEVVIQAVAMLVLV